MPIVFSILILIILSSYAVADNATLNGNKEGNSVILPTWGIAYATIGVAIVTAITQILVWKKQRQENQIRVLMEIARIFNSRESMEDRRAIYGAHANRWETRGASLETKDYLKVCRAS